MPLASTATQPIALFIGDVDLPPRDARRRRANPPARRLAAASASTSHRHTAAPEAASRFAMRDAEAARAAGDDRGLAGEVVVVHARLTASTACRSTGNSFQTGNRFQDCFDLSTSAPRASPHLHVDPHMSTTAVERCLSIVEALVDESAGVSLVDLAARLDMPNSAIHRTLAILASRGYVRQDPATQAYALTLRLSTLGFRLLGARHLPDAGQLVLAAPRRGDRRVLPARRRRRQRSHLDRASAGLDAGAALRAADGRRSRAARDRHGQGLARDAAGRRGTASRRRARLSAPASMRNRGSVRQRRRANDRRASHASQGNAASRVRACHRRRRARHRGDGSSVSRERRSRARPLPAP